MMNNDLYPTFPLGTWDDSFHVITTTMWERLMWGENNWSNITSWIFLAGDGLGYEILCLNSVFFWVGKVADQKHQTLGVISKRNKRHIKYTWDKCYHVWILLSFEGKCSISIDFKGEMRRWTCWYFTVTPMWLIRSRKPEQLDFRKVILMLVWGKYKILKNLRGSVHL